MAWLDGACWVRCALLPRSGSSSWSAVTPRGNFRNCKRDFERVLIASGLVNPATKLNPPAAEKMWWLSVAPVAAPGDSKHGTGYALDISGNNFETARISNLLGATLSFNEASHVHVEWKEGVKIPL